MTWLEPILDGAKKELQGALASWTCLRFLVLWQLTLKICTMSGTG